jgi:hypothetical protein
MKNTDPPELLPLFAADFQLLLALFVDREA